MTDQQISHYRILERLAAGGMGVVYRAHDITLGRTVALKLLPEELMGDSERRRRFLREARTAASLNHPGICTIYEVGEDRGRTFIAMELVPGVTLASKLANGPLPIPDLLYLALEIAEGLAEAHAHGITHRDLKPQNLMVMPNGHAKVLDFGLAKATGPVPNDDTLPSSTLSREGLVVGTVPYLSPSKRLVARSISRSDIFSFGTVLYEMAAGRRPFRGVSVASVVAEILRAEPELLTILRPALPRDVARIISRCLQKKPEDRYNDTKDLVIELREAQGATSSGTGVLRPAPSRRFVLWAGAGLLLVTPIVGTWLLRVSRMGHPNARHSLRSRCGP